MYPPTRTLTEARFLERRLLQYQLRGRAPVAMGPLIALIDLSQSTEGPIEVWEKALACALVMEAVRTRRAARVIAFSGANDPLPTWDFPAGLAPATRVVRLTDLSSTWIGGGTDWNGPITQGLEILQEPGWRQADLVLLTDGQARLDPEVATTVRHFTARGLRLITVLLGARPPVDAVAQWSTQVLTTPPTLEGAATILSRVHHPGTPRPH